MCGGMIILEWRSIGNRKLPEILPNAWLTPPNLGLSAPTFSNLAPSPPLQPAVCLLQTQMLKKYTAWSPRFRKHFKLLESVQNSRSYHKTKIACQNEFSTVKNTPDKIMKKLVHGNLGNLIFSTRIWWILFWTYLREFWIFFVENFFKKSVWFFSVSKR